MDREIKFRAFWADTKKLIDDFDEQYVVAACNDDCFIVNQYTGIKDKNGVEKYHGDIKKTLNIIGEFEEPLTGEPEINNGRFQCDTKIVAKITEVDFVAEITGVEVDRIAGYDMSPEEVYSLFDLPSTIGEEEFTECILEPIRGAGFDVNSVEDIIACMTEGEIIGNKYENPELMEQK